MPTKKVLPYSVCPSRCSVCGVCPGVELRSREPPSLCESRLLIITYTLSRNKRSQTGHPTKCEKGRNMHTV